MSSTFQSWVWTGDAYEPATGVPLSDRGFRYGMAIFESLAIRRTVEFLNEHCARLRVACSELAWSLPDAALDASDALLQSIPAPAFARIYITAGDGAPTQPVTSPRVILMAEPRELKLPDSYAIQIATQPYLPAKPGYKTANYWPNIDAFSAARAAGYEESVLLNPRGDVVSASMANLFAVIDGQILTPPIVTGARHGVVREWVMRHRPVLEQSITPEALAAASEVFLTSSWIGVMPVRSCNDRLLETGISTKLRNEFFA